MAEVGAHEMMVEIPEQLTKYYAETDSLIAETYSYP
jgi:hypothetical protein